MDGLTERRRFLSFGFIRELLDNGNGDVAELAEDGALNGEDVVVAGDGGVAGVDGSQGSLEPELSVTCSVCHQGSNGVLQLALGVQDVLLAISQTLLNIRVKLVVVDEDFGVGEDAGSVSGGKPKGKDCQVFEVWATWWVGREDLNAEVSGWGRCAHLVDHSLCVCCILPAISSCLVCHCSHAKSHHPEEFCRGIHFLFTNHSRSFYFSSYWFGGFLCFLHQDELSMDLRTGIYSGRLPLLSIHFFHT